MSWIGVDLDGTLAQYEGWQGPTHIGAPVPRMVERVKAWLDQGREVRVMTARVGEGHSEEEVAQVRRAIGDWTEAHIGQRLRVTATKDYSMIELWDDRCVRVMPNTGEPCCERIA